MGTVAAITGATLTLRVVGGRTETFAITAQTRVHDPSGQGLATVSATTVPVGARVSLVSVPGTPEPLARTLRILAPAPGPRMSPVVSSSSAAARASVTAPTPAAAVASRAAGSPRPQAVPAGTPRVAAPAAVSPGNKATAPKKRARAAAQTVQGSVRSLAGGVLELATASGSVVSLLLGKRVRVRLAHKGAKATAGTLASVVVGSSVRVSERKTAKGMVARGIRVAA